ncbi:hypothetical protein AB9128_09130 [Streptomyces cinereoruber]|uniref:hypothetical protein n=1 Tax=Streptomyces cinereoruber TaxID=67260 RepID=UPI003EBA1ED6
MHNETGLLVVTVVLSAPMRERRSRRKPGCFRQTLLARVHPCGSGPLPVSAAALVPIGPIAADEPHHSTKHREHGMKPARSHSLNRCFPRTDD